MKINYSIKNSFYPDEVIKPGVVVRCYSLREFKMISDQAIRLIPGAKGIDIRPTACWKKMEEKHGSGSVYFKIGKVLSSGLIDAGWMQGTEQGKRFYEDAGYTPLDRRETE